MIIDSSSEGAGEFLGRLPTATLFNKTKLLTSSVTGTVLVIMLNVRQRKHLGAYRCARWFIRCTLL
jgi:hypothetical protein